MATLLEQEANEHKQKFLMQFRIRKGGDTIVKKNIISLILCLSILGCAAPLYDKSRLQFVDPHLTRKDLIQDGLAILPVTAGAGEEGYRRPMAEHLAATLKSLRSDIPFTTPQESMQKLNNAKLAQTYSSMLESYERTAILDKSALQKMGNAIGTRYLLQPKLIKFHVTGGVEWGALSNRPVKTEKHEVEVFAQIWDTQKGDVAWEAVGSVVVQSGEMTYVEQNLDDLMIAASKGLVAKLP